MGRKAYPFAAAERGGHVAATLYSLLGACGLNGAEPYAYLQCLGLIFSRPWRFFRAHVGTAVAARAWRLQRVCSA